MTKRNAKGELAKVMRLISEHRTGKRKDLVVRIERGEGVVRVSVNRGSRDRQAPQSRLANVR